VVFETTLKNLTDEQSPVAVHFENGQTREWNLARYDEPQGDAQDKTRQG
jgi:hypothetical protein